MSEDKIKYETKASNADRFIGQVDAQVIQPFYTDEYCQIYNADCLDIMIALRPDLILTDPPYGIKINQNEKRVGTRKDLSRKANGLTWDDAVPTSIYFEIMKHISKNQIVFGANYFWHSFYPSQCYIIWDKRGNLPEVPFADTEFAWTSFTNRMSKKYTVINHGFVKDSQDTKTGHPTQKPTELFKAILEDFSKQDDIILDPFLGSGTTLLAAKSLGRKAIGIDINEKYCEMAANRLKDTQPEMFYLKDKAV